MAYGDHFDIDAWGEICVSALRERSVRGILDRTLESLESRLNLFGVCFCEWKDQELVIWACRGLKGSARGDRSGVGVQTMVGQVAMSGCSACRSGSSLVSPFQPVSESEEGTWFLCVPLCRREKVLGTLSVNCHCEDSEIRTGILRGLEQLGSWLAEVVDIRRHEFAEFEGLVEENRRLRQALDHSRRMSEFLGNSGEMKRVHERIRQVAAEDSAVLIRGHAGTGKGLVARTIHQISTRSQDPLLTVNCKTMAAGELERILLGDSKAGADDSDRQGLVTLQGRGTLLLDDIDGLPLAIQARLVAVLRSSVSVEGKRRLIAISSADLEQLVSAGEFLGELYDLLAGTTLILPDLKDRRSDIMLLTEHFIEQFNLRYNKQVRRLSTTTINMLVAYHWPGNVQELENCLEHAVVSAMGDTIHGYNLPASLQTGEGKSHSVEDSADFNTKVASYERELIIDALKRTNGKMSAAASELGISPRVIHYKIKLHGIIPDWYKKNV